MIFKKYNKTIKHNLNEIIFESFKQLNDQYKCFIEFFEDYFRIKNCIINCIIILYVYCISLFSYYIIYIIFMYIYIYKWVKMLIDR